MTTSRTPFPMRLPPILPHWLVQQPHIQAIAEQINDNKSQLISCANDWNHIMSTSTLDSMQSLHEALEPLGVVRTENDDLGTWIHDSFAALEKLHEELTQWQSELARKETQLDLRTDALEKCPQGGSENQQHQLAELQEELAAAKEDAKVLEEEKAQQLIQYENLVSKYEQIKSELHAAQEQVSQLVSTIESQRHSAEKAREVWQKEFEQLHVALDKHYAKLLVQLEKSTTLEEGTETGEPDPTKTVPSVTESPAPRQRNQSRRRAKK